MARITSLLTGLGKKQKGDAFEELVLHSLRLHPTYATQLETVCHHKDIPKDICRELNLPETDEGIDLVARTMEGSYWAIQGKYREDENYFLTRRELAVVMVLWVLLRRILSVNHLENPPRQGGISS